MARRLLCRSITSTCKTALARLKPSAACHWASRLKSGEAPGARSPKASGICKPAHRRCEEAHRSAACSVDGIDPTRFNGLWFEQVIQQNVRQQIEDLKI